VTLDVWRLHEACRGLFEAYLDDLQALVNVDCGTFVADGVNQVAGHMERRFDEAGWRVHRRSHRPADGEQQLGDAVVATLDGSRPERVLLIGHMDTVFPDGTAAARPFRIEGSTAYGPGVSDMKGGLLAGYYAVRALQELGAELGEGLPHITYVCNPDEEIGSPFSGPVILEQAGSADACFVLEGARENGDIVSARKGVVDLRLIVHGRAAHAGVEPERGRSATLQAAHAAIALHALNGRWPGVTVNVGVIQGGTRPNVVAQECLLHTDLRVPTAAAQHEVMAEIERIAAATTVPDTSIELIVGAGFPPMEKTEPTARLAERAVAIAAELGFELRDASTGGASDANPVAGMGVPTLDGLGPIGGSDHAPGEWLDLESVVPRMALLGAMIAGTA
jgi:glutamate carboxypeptidase